MGWLAGWLAGEIQEPDLLRYMYIHVHTFHLSIHLYIHACIYVLLYVRTENVLFPLPWYIPTPLHIYPNFLSKRFIILFLFLLIFFLLYFKIFSRRVGICFGLGKDGGPCDKYDEVIEAEGKSWEEEINGNKWVSEWVNEWISWPTIEEEQVLCFALAQLIHVTFYTSISIHPFIYTSIHSHSPTKNNPLPLTLLNKTQNPFPKKPAYLII